MPLALRAAGLTDRGRVKPDNEDAMYWLTRQAADAEPLGLFIVADGIGGQASGEVASHWAIQTVKAELASLFNATDPGATRRLSTEPGATRRLAEPEIERQLRAAINRANQVIVRYAQHRPRELGEMGSTITLVLMRGSQVAVANVGDSRTYRIRRGQIQPLTREHSLVASLVETGQIKHDELYNHPQRNLIYRSLGAKPHVDVDVFHTEAQAGDTLLLCSDGLWEMVRDPSLAQIVTREASSPLDACRRLIKAANHNGGEDNISVITVWIEESV